MGVDWKEWRGSSPYPDSEKEADLQALVTALDKCRLYADMYYLIRGDEGAHRAALEAAALLKPRQWRKNPIEW